MSELIAMFLAGMIFMLSIETIIVMSMFSHDEDEAFPEEPDLDQMCLWYDNEYGKDD